MGGAMTLDWQPMKTAPKDEKPFLAWYGARKYGPSYGTMHWRAMEGRFHSLTLGTQTKQATHCAADLTGQTKGVIGVHGDAYALHLDLIRIL